MIDGECVDRGGACVCERPFGFQEIELAELAFAVSDPGDARGFLRGGKRRAGGVPRRGGRVRDFDASGRDLLLRIKQREPFRALLRTFTLRPDTWNNPEMDEVECDLPLWKAGLRVTDPRRPQPRYKVDVWLEAEDTAVDSYPGTVALTGTTKKNLKVTVPTDARQGQTIHLILAVQDNGTPTLTRYQRVVITVD